MTFQGQPIHLTHKVFAYITHHTRLLVFRHPHTPEAGIQVPAGTRGEDEPPEEAVLREAREETGLTHLRMNAFLGECDYPFPHRNQVARRRFYHLLCEEEPPLRWRHYERYPSEGGPEPILFELYWVDLPDSVPALTPGHDAMLPQLLEIVFPGARG
jgi:8-oxo-dGTP pyrophosphatase MutT (NUDIX family)